MSDNITISGSADELRALFGDGADASSFQGSDEIPDGTCRLQFGSETVDVEPAGENIAAGFRANANALGLDSGRVVTYSVDGEIVPASDMLEAGKLYVATTKHDDKG